MTDIQKSFKEKLEQDPDDAIMWIEYADFLLEELEQADQAIAAYHEANKINPGLDLRLRLGSAHGIAGQFLKAEKLIKETLKERPRSHGYTILADIFIQQNKFNKATIACNMALKLDPGFDEAYYLLGEATRQKSKRDAIGFYRKAIELDPVYQLAWQAVGRELIAIEELNEAIECLEKAILLDPADGWSKLYLANAFWRTGDLERAEHNYKAALNSFPEIPEAHKWYAQFLLAHGRSEESDRHQNLWEARN